MDVRLNRLKMGRAGIEPATHGFSGTAPSSLLPEVFDVFVVMGARKGARLSR